MKQRNMARLTFSLFLCSFLPMAASAQTVLLKGRVTDPSGNALPNASVQLLGHGASGNNQVVEQTTSGAEGRFELTDIAAGRFQINVDAEGFQPVLREVTVRSENNPEMMIGMNQLSTRVEKVSVTADVNDLDVQSPDPAIKVFATEDLLDANPGRPGAPISIPGYPIETASSGIKAPQYFAPGVAGDHGEPIAQYIQVGSYLVPNNLSANAHGNGYADPNIYIASAIESVQVDGGAFNVLEGNHALNLAAIYGLRSHLSPFLTLTGDNRDITATTGFSPSANSWVAIEGSFGNGFLDRLEHRKQFKFNDGQVLHAGDHTLTLFGIAYLGYGYVAGLRPIFGFNSVDTAVGWAEYPDTVDPRQKDQTHTALVALNDVWKLTDHQELQLSGFFRTYNLSLYSDFGLGLIRQSEFRTVTGGNATYVNRLAKIFTLLAGVDYEREAPRRDNLDHYNFYNLAEPAYYGAFIKIDSNNVTIAPVSPYIVGAGQLSKYVRYYLGWRRDEIYINNQDLLTPTNSSTEWVGVNPPKATLAIVPKESWLVPLIAFSFGKSFHNTDLKLTLGHETQTAEYGKIDPDQGLQFDLGPGRIRYLAATLRQSIPHGSLLVTFEQADARLVNTSFSIVPEAPRLIGDVLATYQKLPFRLQAKGEFEYV